MTLLWPIGPPHLDVRSCQHRKPGFPSGTFYLASAFAALCCFREWLFLVRSGSGTPQASPSCSEPWLLPILLTPLELHFQIPCCLANILVTERLGLLVPIAMTSSKCALVLSVKPQGTTASAENVTLSGGHCPLLRHFVCGLWPSLPAACAWGNT